MLSSAASALYCKRLRVDGGAAAAGGLAGIASATVRNADGQAWGAAVKHSSEVQGVDVALGSAGAALCASASANGWARVSRLWLLSGGAPPGGKAGERPPEKRQRGACVEEIDGYWLPPAPAAANGEPGFVAVSLCGAEGADAAEGAEPLVATAHFFARVVALHAGERLVRAVRSTHNPYSVQSIRAGPAAGCLAVADGHQLAIWDMRVAKRGGCVQRLTPGGARLHALSVAPDGGTVGVAGAEKFVHLYDCRAWSVRSRWGGAGRLAVRAIALDGQGMIHVAGEGAEYACGSSAADGKATHSFRGDSPWVGFDVSHSGSVALLSELGSLYAHSAGYD